MARVRFGGWGKSRDKSRGGGIDKIRVRMKMRRVRSGSIKNSQDKGNKFRARRCLLTRRRKFVG